MTSAFAHFDASHQENFCAALLLLVMEIEEPTKHTVVTLVRSALDLPPTSELVGMGREARLAEGDPEDGVARVDLWLQFREAGAFFYVFVEVKTHANWDASAVAAQVRDQARRPKLARTSHPIRGSVLLAPGRLVDRVRAVATDVPALTWATLLARLRAAGEPSALLRHALRHWEDHVDRPIGIADRPFADFAQLSSTLACLKAFLLGCIADIGGKESRTLNTTSSDGEPLRAGGWAWHGFSIPFKSEAKSYRLGIYTYVEAPPGEEDARTTPWLEAYEDDRQEPIVSLRFAPPTLAPTELDAVRECFNVAWRTPRPPPRGSVHAPTPGQPARENPCQFPPERVTMKGLGGLS